MTAFLVMMVQWLSTVPEGKIAIALEMTLMTRLGPANSPQTANSRPPARPSRL